MQVHILSVPSKGRFPHSEIKISRIHSSNFHIVIVIYPVQNRSKLLNVPNLRDKIILNIVICTKRQVLLLQYFEALFIKRLYLAVFICNWSWYISSIYRGYKRKVFPIFSFNVLQICHLRCLIFWASCFLVKFFYRYCFFVYIDTVIDASVSIHNLFDRVIYFKVTFFNIEFFFPRHPFFRWNDLFETKIQGIL